MENTTINTIPEFDFDIVVADINIEDTKDQPTDEGQTNNNGPDNIGEPSQTEQTPDGDTTTETEIVDYGKDADPTAVTYYEQIKERGFWVGEGFDGTWKSLETMFDELPNRILSDLVQQAPEVGKQLVRLAFSSPDLSKEDLVKFMETYIDEVSVPTNDIETMDDARSFLEKVYKDRGLSDRSTERTIQGLEDDDLLMEEAKEELTKSKETDKHKRTEQMIAEKENENIKKQQDLLAYSNKIATELQETGWKTTRVNEVKKVLSGNTLSTLLNEAIQNPKALIKLADFVSYFKNGDIDYSAFVKQLETPKAIDLKTRVESAINSPGIQTRSVNTNHLTVDPNKEIPIV